MVLAEGARGSLTEKIISKYNLRKDSQPQVYSLGIKELWEVPDGVIEPGYLEHTAGWPTPWDTYAGGFMYSKTANLIHLGYVVGLNYKNPYLNPYEEFQQWKTSKHIKKVLEKGTCIKYGARVIASGGYESLPKMVFPGGLLVGCSAGLVNLLKIKGTHNAIKSGVLAAEAINDKSGELVEGVQLTEYQKKFDSSQIIEELRKIRHSKAGFKSGMLFGMLSSGLESMLGWSLVSKVKYQKDSETIEKASQHKKIDYPKHDGKITFDILESVSRSDTFHDHNSPSHLVVKPGQERSWQKSLKEYGGFEQRYCPAKVYEFVEKDGKEVLQINAQNCVHCKTCSIKSFEEYLDWNVPQGGEGPQYKIM